MFTISFSEQLEATRVRKETSGRNGENTSEWENEEVESPTLYSGFSGFL